MLRRTLFALGCVAALSLIGASPARAAQEYVALGDSYSSGTGTRDYYNEPCQRSERSFAQIIDRERPSTQLTLAACAGAETGDVLSNQLGSLNGATDWVTITIGGNDAGFSRVLVECAKPRWAGNCGAKITEARRFIKDVLPGRLQSVYGAIARAAPRATVIVLSYPRLFRGEDCDAGSFFSEREMARLNDTADLMRDKTSRYARSSGSRFVFKDAIPRFVGHAVCSAHEWINGLSSPAKESYHPNRAGHRSGYAPLVRSVMG